MMHIQFWNTVIMGNKRLYEIMKEKDAILMQKRDFTDERRYPVPVNWKANLQR